MFSANENLLLRQHKRRIVEKVESMMPEDALDMGTSVMVMQVSCTAPGCVPLETAIIIVFPNASTELVPQLPESQNGGSYKTKILKPMADVTDDDILDALPPVFEGGRRTMARLCRAARDVMLAQITQLFEEEDDSKKDRLEMAAYLQQCLQRYIDNDCIAPEFGEAFEEKTIAEGDAGKGDESKANGGNFVIRRSAEDDTFTPALNGGGSAEGASSSSAFLRNSSSGADAFANTQFVVGNAVATEPSSLLERAYAPGVHQAACPCCNPDDPDVVASNMMNF